MFDGFFLQHFVGNLLAFHVHAIACGELLGGFIHVKREIPAEKIHAVRLRGRVVADEFPEFADRLLDVFDRDRRVHRADMNEAAGFRAVQPRMAVERLGVIQIENEPPVAPLDGEAVMRRLKLRRHPLLPLVCAEILDDERRHVLDAQEPLARRVNGEAAEVAGDPPTAKLFRDRRRRAGAAETIQHEIARVGTRLDDAF